VESFSSRSDTVYCTCFGDPHCRTFDRLRLSYQGTCKYNLASINATTPLPTGFSAFQIYARNEQRVGSTVVSYDRYIEVVYSNHTVRLARSVSVQSLAIPVDVTVSRFKVYSGRHTQRCMLLDTALVKSRMTYCSWYHRVPALWNNMPPDQCHITDCTPHFYFLLHRIRLSLVVEISPLLRSRNLAYAHFFYPRCIYSPISFLIVRSSQLHFVIDRPWSYSTIYLSKHVTDMKWRLFWLDHPPDLNSANDRTTQRFLLFIFFLVVLLERC